MALESNFYMPMQTANQQTSITPASMEKEILNKVKDLAVKAVNWLLKICEYFKMSQKEGENVCHYVARLKGVADLCNFTVGSGTKAVSYVKPDGPGPIHGQPQGQADHEGHPQGGRNQGTPHQQTTTEPHQETGAGQEASQGGGCTTKPGE
jgi:hypothetical protein